MSINPASSPMGANQIKFASSQAYKPQSPSYGDVKQKVSTHLLQQIQNDPKQFADKLASFLVRQSIDNSSFAQSVNTDFGVNPSRIS